MNGNLMRLYARNRGAANRKFEVSAADDATDATVYVYDVIVNSEAEAEWWGGVAPGAFVRQIAALKGKTIHLRFNCPGGSVFGARAMEQALHEHDGQVIAHIDGYAASAASFLMLAADEVVMAPGAMVMIHNAWAIAYGNAEDMLQMAALLEKIDGTLVETYCARTKQDKQTVCDWMAAETWFTAEEAVAAGLADSIANAGESDQKASAPAWDLSAYLRGPGPAARAKTSEPTDPAANDRDDYVRRLEHLNRIAA